MQAIVCQYSHYFHNILFLLLFYCISNCTQLFIINQYHTSFIERQQPIDIFAEEVSHMTLYCVLHAIYTVIYNIILTYCYHDNNHSDPPHHQHICIRSITCDCDIADSANHVMCLMHLYYNNMLLK